jgi:hypothetical protein
MFCQCALLLRGFYSHHIYTKLGEFRLYIELELKAGGRAGQGGSLPLTVSARCGRRHPEKNLVGA